MTQTSRCLPICVLIGITLLSGCKSNNVEVIDLNKVLAVFDETVKKRETEEPEVAEKLDPSAEEKAEDTKAFLTEFADGLNKAKLISPHLGVVMLDSGAIQGFKDPNKNRSKESSESDLFLIEFDPDGNRIIATQQVEGETYRRDHHYTGSYYRFYYFHSLHSSMWRRQNRYYNSGSDRGTSGLSKPNYNSMPMSSNNYHSSAVSRVRTATAARNRASSSSSSARSRTGSRSFSFGK